MQLRFQVNCFKLLTLSIVFPTIICFRLHSQCLIKHCMYNFVCICTHSMFISMYWDSREDVEAGLMCAYVSMCILCLQQDFHVRRSFSPETINTIYLSIRYIHTYLFIYLFILWYILIPFEGHLFLKRQTFELVSASLYLCDNKGSYKQAQYSM